MRVFLLIFLAITSFSLSHSDILSKDINEYNPSVEKYIYLNFLEIKEGDDSTGLSNQSQDSSWYQWRKFDFNNKPKANYLWVRTKIKINGGLNTNPGIIPQMFVSAFEVYWDGKPAGKNGTIGKNSTEEKPGNFMERFYLKEEMCSQGVHTLTLKISNNSSGSDIRKGFILFGSVPDIVSDISSWLVEFSFLLGIVFLSSIFNLFLFVNSKKIQYLIFSILCIVVLISSILNLYWAFYNVKTTFLDIQNTWLPVKFIIIAVLSPLFFLYEFSLENKRTVIIIFFTGALIYLLSVNTGAFNKIVLYTQLLSTSVVILFALFKNKSGSIIALSGIIAAIIVYLSNFMTGVSEQITVSVVIILFYNFYLAKQFAQREKTEREALLKSSRLENELLKKNINPHFLMNSLNSIIVWLRKDPEKAVKLVSSLADEFRLVSQISNSKLIPVEKEISLCKAHIEIMNHRKGAEFSLVTEGISGNEEISPMIFHTLIENGITHGYENRNKGYFKLTKTEAKDFVKYILFNDSSVDINNSFCEGTGIKYIKSRLEESHSSKWKFYYGPVNGGWEAVVEIYN